MTVNLRRLALGLLFIQSIGFAVPDTLSEIQKRKELRIGLQPGFIPFEMRKANGEWVGFDVDMATAFAQSLGVKVSFLDTKWDGIFAALQARRFDMIIYGLTITEGRKQGVLFSDPYFKAGLSVLVPTALKQRIKNLSELNDPKYTIAVQLGTTGDIHATKNLTKAKILRFDSEQDGANSVLFKKTSAFLYDRPFVHFFVNKNKGKLALLPDPVSEEAYGAVVRKGDSDLIAQFNAFLKKWKTSGDYDKAIKKHFEEMPWLKDFPDLKS